MAHTSDVYANSENLEHELQRRKCRTDCSELLENSERLLKREVLKELHDLRVVRNEPEIEEQLSVCRDHSTRTCFHRPTNNYDLVMTIPITRTYDFQINVVKFD